MNSFKETSDLNNRDFTVKPFSRINRIRTGPRLKIRRLLHSFPPVPLPRQLAGPEGAGGGAGHF
jgi:hypothetical protein